MKAEFTSIIEHAPEGGFWAICLEAPGANGQGETIEDAKNNLSEAIELLLEDRKAENLLGLMWKSASESQLGQKLCAILFHKQTLLA